MGVVCRRGRVEELMRVVGGELSTSESNSIESIEIHIGE